MLLPGTAEYLGLEGEPKLSVCLSVSNLPLHQLNKVLGRNIICLKVSLIRKYIAMI